LDRMQPDERPKYIIAYRWLSYCIVVAFACYCLFTLSVIFLPKTTHSIMPRQKAVYNAFVRQNWQLFTVTQVYVKELNFVLRDKLNRQQTDTIPLVKYLINEKRKHAPFNNYEDALDALVHRYMYGVELRLTEKRRLLKKQYPGQTDSFYMRQSSLLLENDSLHREYLDNLISFGKYVLRQQHIDTVNREFQLVQVHNYTLPKKPQFFLAGDSLREPVFMSTYKSW
jgi:hypothetical protein